MIGISMALTIVVCVGSFSLIYASLDDVFGDFVSRGQEVAAVRTPTPQSAGVAQGAADGAGQAATDEQQAPAPTATTPPEPTAAPSPTPTDEFAPDYQLDSSGSVNLRSGPGTRFETVTAITPEQPLQYMGVSEVTTDPEADQLAAGQTWMEFRTEDGLEGWIREIDVAEYVP